MRQFLLLITLMAATAASADFAPPDSDRYTGMRDIMLAYLHPGGWQQDDFLPYVAYLDKAAGGVPRDWFYDAWLFLMFGGAPTGGDYINGTAKFSDWQFYVDQLYAPGQNLAALEASIEDVGKRLNKPHEAFPIILMIPYVSKRVEDFGDVDGDGQGENAAVDADRLKACRWVVDALLQRWEQARFRHLRLDGFYWMNEGIGGADGELARATGVYVHEKHLNFHWIPWFAAPGYEKCHDMGFDLTIMQPNYAFMNDLTGAVVPDEDRLTQNANLARKLGLGVEMELDYSTDTDPADRLKLQLYLNHGVPDLDGYMVNCARAYYQTYDSIAKLYASDNPECNQLYDDLYRFHLGTYQRRPVSLVEGATARLNGKPAPALTDGLWLTRPEQATRLLTASAPARVEVDLGRTEIIGDVRVHLAAKDGGPVAPSVIRVATSSDGKTFSEAAEVGCPPLHETGDWRTGYALALFEPRFVRTIRLELVGSPGATLGVDEVVCFPAPHLLWGVPARVQADGPAGNAAALTDGRLARGKPGAALRFKRGQGQVTFDLGESWILKSAWAHVNSPGVAASASVRLGDGPTTRASQKVTAARRGEAWLEIPLPNTPARTIAFRLSGDANTTWDELQVRRAPNLASGKPYTLDPPFPAQYPDTGGRELTDGLLTQQGFGDGRTIGWFGQPVTVLLDLGAPQPVDGVRVFTEGGGYAAVYHPEGFSVQGSADGTHWRLLRDATPDKQVTFTEDVGTELNELAWQTLTFPAASARFVKLSFPAQAWLMLSEIEVMSGGRNVAAGSTYTATPATSGTKYADTGGRLTDGAYSRPGDGWAKAVGWSDGAPQVVLDLLEPAALDAVRVHVLGGGNAGVYFPRQVQVSVSSDGTTWSDPITASPAPADPGDAHLTAFLTAPLSGRTARYVRVQVERHGWGMLDEIEVVGR